MGGDATDLVYHSRRVIGAKVTLRETKQSNLGSETVESLYVEWLIRDERELESIGCRCVDSHLLSGRGGMKVLLLLTSDIAPEERSAEPGRAKAGTALRHYPVYNLYTSVCMRTHVRKWRLTSQEQMGENNHARKLTFYERSVANQSDRYQNKISPACPCTPM